MSKNRSLVSIRLVIICYLGCNFMLLNSSNYEMLSQLTQQINSLSTAVSRVSSFVLSDGYLLSDYLKTKGKTLEKACHDTTDEGEVHIDRKAYQDLLGKGLTFKNLHIADKFKKHTSFSSSLMGDFTPWALQIPIAVGKVGDFSVLVDCDSSINIYQLRVLTQKRSDCSLHAVKNLLWLMAALDSDKLRFSDYYFKMLDPRAYENFLISSGCPLNPPEAYRHVVDIYTKTTNQKFLPNLPLNTNNYIKNIIELAAFSPTASSIGAIPRGKQQIKIYSIKEDLAHIALVIKNLEKNIDEKELQKTLQIITLLLGSGKFKYRIEDLPAQFEKIHKTSTYRLGIYLLLSTGAPAHATSLVINKYNNKIEYLFCDPLNWPFTRRGTFFHGYKAALRSIVTIVNDPTVLKEALLRYLVGQVFMNGYNNKIIYQLLKSKVYESALYSSIYKKPFCELIKPQINQGITEEDYMLLCKN